MKTKTLSILIISAFLILISSSLSAQLQRDSKYGFTINVPQKWSKNSYMDGTDKVYDFMSPDENAAVQLRAFEAPNGLTLDLLVNVFEEQMLPAGAIKESVQNHVSKTGIPGKLGTYGFNYNGIQVAMGVFYAIQNGNGYIISAMIPKSMLQEKSKEVKFVTESFSLSSSSNSGGSTGLGGLTGGTTSSSNSTSFKITDFILTDRVDANDNAINPTNKFNPQTREIFVVMKYQGGTNKDISASWIYKNSNRNISTDLYNFTSKNGGNAIVSITKPNNGWPTGNYSVEFRMGGSLIKELSFTVAQKSSGLGGISGSTGTSGSISGRYDLISRSDNNNGYNFLYFIFNNDGTMVEKHQPKNSGNYIGEHIGLWKVKGNMLEIQFDWGTYSYEINGNTLKHTDKQGVVSIYKKK